MPPSWNRVIRAPVPWHNSYLSIQQAQSVQLFTSNSIMLELQQLWCDRLVPQQASPYDRMFAGFD